MALYIKANRLVAEFLKKDKLRLRLADGCYMLWQADMLPFGPLYEIQKTCERIGAIPLQPWEARQEQDGTVLRTLPAATDERFILPDTGQEAQADPDDTPGTAAQPVNPDDIHGGEPATEEESEVNDEL